MCSLVSNVESALFKQLVPSVAAGRSLMAPKGPGRKEKGAQHTNVGADAKIHYDEANGHLKMGSYTKALSGYSLVSAESRLRS
jgi:hypothetical protein